VAVKQVLVSQGRAVVDEVPAPGVEPGTILVRVDHSCISVGTELSGLGASGTPLWRRAVAQPHKIVTALQLTATQGVGHTLGLLQGKLSAGTPTGYSAAGVVLEAGEGVDDLRPADRVACAGAQCAHHAEIIRVPRNLAVRVPDGVDLAAASTVALGAIALQGVRRAQPTLGETFVVIGLGLLGQLAAQLLGANGCRVIGTDLDPARVRVARELGMAAGLGSDGGEGIEQVARLTGGAGADGVIVTAATPCDEVLSTAFRMCRKKGRVVLVGDVGLNLKRADFYQKEIDFLISTSYGPGRYDPNYEERGLDYPVGYVRWTENRNMAEYLRLVAEGKVKVAPLVGAVYPVEEATAAYDRLKDEADRPLAVLLSYPGRVDGAAPARTIPNPAARLAGAGQIRLALIGAGGFAKAVHLPNLRALSRLYHLEAVVSRTGHNAAATAKQFGASYATTDYQAVLADPRVDAVLITTRHDLHGRMVLDALRAGKHVFVEKPLALEQAELDAIAAFYASAPAAGAPPVLLTGFNRRFSRYAARLHEAVRGRGNPMILTYRMNAGYLPLDHWVHATEGGGRNRGEACHVYDLFTYLTGSRVVNVQAQAIAPAKGHYTRRDNFVATMTFEDGSLATLTYTALGSTAHPKEQLEVFVDGTVLALDDYRRLTVAGAKRPQLETPAADKGHRGTLEAFARAVRDGGDWPIPLWQQLQATEIALEVEASLC
jgi:predicted dehydrogenase/threonine dehydrogenase-like Zn-dependent dehydrogenase